MSSPCLPFAGKANEPDAFCKRQSHRRDRRGTALHGGNQRELLPGSLPAVSLSESLLVEFFQKPAFEKADPLNFSTDQLSGELSFGNLPDIRFLKSWLVEIFQDSASAKAGRLKLSANQLFYDFCCRTLRCGCFEAMGGENPRYWVFV